MTWDGVEHQDFTSWETHSPVLLLPHIETNPSKTMIDLVV
jgi:hypothetical protein